MGLLDGTGDRFSLTTSSDFGFGTGDFDVEGWIYIPMIQEQKHYLTLDSGSDTDNVLHVFFVDRQPKNP